MKKILVISVFIPAIIIMGYDLVNSQNIVCPVLDESESSVFNKSSNTFSSLSIGSGKSLVAKDTIRIAVIFVRFEDDLDTSITFWNTIPGDNTIDETIDWMDNTIDSTATENSTNHFNFTNFFRTMSYNQYIVIGDAYHVKIPPLESLIDTTDNEIDRITKANFHALKKLDSLVDLSIYDNYDMGYYVHDKIPDGVLDYAFLVYRTPAEKHFTYLGESFDGLASLGSGTKKLPSGMNVRMSASGSTNHFKSKEKTFNVMIHEVGHDLFGGGHPYADSETFIQNNGRSAAYWGIFAGNYAKPTINAYEKEVLRWINVPTITVDSLLQLDDFVLTGEAYKYQIDTKEYYYFENHQRTQSTSGILSTYDRPNINASDKGLFILHVNLENGYLDCCSYSLKSVVSDGNWDWQNTGFTKACDVTGDWQPIFKKGSPNVNGKSFKDPILQTIGPDGKVKFQNLFLKDSNPSLCREYLLGYGSNDKSGFTKSSVSFISKITNPAFHKFDNTQTNLRMSIVDDQSGIVTLRFDEPTDHYEITEDTHLGGMVFLSDKSLNIDNGATVTVNAGTKFFLNENKKIIVRPGAKLIVNGTQQNPVHFKRLDSTKPWGSIVIHGYNSEFNWAVFDGGTRNVDVMAPETEFNNCVFKNADRPISSYFNQSNQPGKSSFSLTNCRVENGTGLGGIVTYYADADLIDVTSQNNDDDGLWSYNGDVSMRYSVFENNGSRGIYVRNGIIGSYFGDQITLNNRISDNSIGEISLGSNAVLQFGYVDQQSGEMLGGYNSIIKNGSNYHIYNAANSTPAEADLTYWGTSNPVFYGPVNDSYHLSQDPTQNSGSSNLPQSMRGEGELLNGQKQGTGEGAEGNPVIAYLRDLSSAKTTPTASDLALIRRYQKYLEREQKSDEQLLPLHATLAQESKGLSRSSDSKQAEAYLAYQLQREIDQHGRITRYNTLQRARTVLEDERFDQAFSSYELDYYLAHEKFTEFENVLAQAAEKKALSPEEIRFYKEQLSIGKEVAAEFRSSERNPNPAISSGEDSQTVAENSFEVNAYPNPFNPATKLSIDLSERSDVSVELYSVLGQRVMSYQRTGVSAGTHAVSVNGAQLASGIYIARVRVESQSKVQTRDVRLTLIK